MANPITWRTINSRSNEGASRMMTSAGESIDSGFDTFNKLLEGTQKVREDNRDTRIDNNTMDARSFLAGITDPEEMARVQASGEFRDMVQGKGAMIDREALQGAGREHLTGLRQDANAEYKYGQTQQAQADQPIVDQALTGINSLDLGMGTDAAGPAVESMREQIRNSGASASGQNTALEALDQRFAQIQSQEQAQTQADRRTTTFNQTQDDRDETEAEEAAVDMGTKRLNEIVANADTPSAARAQTQAWLQSEEAAGIPPAQRNKLQAEAEPLWTQNNDLTENQATQIEQTKATQQARAQEVIAQQELEQQRIVEDNPVDPKLSFLSEDRIDLTQAKKYAEEQVDDFWTKSNIDSALDLVKTERGVRKTDNVPWGNLIKLAVDGAKERDVFGDDYDLDSEPMNQELMAVYDRWVETTENQKNVRQGEDDLLTVRKTQTDQVSNSVREIREALKEANKNARSLRGGK